MTGADNKRAGNGIARASRGTDLTAVTYNVHGCKGLDGKISPARIARLLQTLSPDAVALQEVDAGRSRSAFTHQPRAIAEALGMRWYFYSPRGWRDGRYGCAVLSKWPMTPVKAEDLPRLDPSEPRSAIWVRIRKGGRSISLVCTHLGLRRRERALQVQALLGSDWLGGDGACAGPCILCGDFNFTTRSAPYRAIGDRFTDAQRAAPGHRPRHTFLGIRTLDHIFVSGLDILGAGVPRHWSARIASDHLPLWTRLRFPGAPRPPG